MANIHPGLFVQIDSGLVQPPGRLTRSAGANKLEAVDASFNAVAAMATLETVENACFPVCPGY